MAAGKTFAPIRGRRMRVTRLDECGAPVTGPTSQRVSKGFVSVKMSPQYQDIATVTVSNAAGELDFNDVGDSMLMMMNVDVAFTRVDPDLFSLITGQQVVVNGAAAATGFRLSGGVPILGGWGLEVWSSLGGDACVGVRNYGYFLLPFLRGGKVGDFTVENGAASFTLSSSTRENPGWGTGPYNVVDTSATGAPVVPGKLLTAIGPKDHFHLETTPVPPPVETAGLVALPTAA